MISHHQITEPFFLARKPNDIHYLKAVAKARLLELDVVKRLLYYNAVHSRVVSDIVSCAPTALRRYAQVGNEHLLDGHLTLCYPFEFAKNRNGVFIVNDYMLEEFIKKSLNIPF